MLSDTLVQFVETDTQTYNRKKITNYKTNRITVRTFIAFGYENNMAKVIITVISENELTNYAQRTTIHIKF